MKDCENVLEIKGAGVTVIVLEEEKKIEALKIDVDTKSEVF